MTTCTNCGQLIAFGYINDPPLCSACEAEKLTMCEEIQMFTLEEYQKVLEYIRLKRLKEEENDLES